MSHEDQGFPQDYMPRVVVSSSDSRRARTAAVGGGRHRSMSPARSRGAHGKRRSPVEGSEGGKRKRGSFARELPLLVAVALGLALVIKAFLIQAFYIPSSSMEPTLLIGDRVLVNKLAYDLHRVHRGDIVVFNGAGSFVEPAPRAQPDNPLGVVAQAVGSAFGANPSGEKDFIKRVIGLPGDRVACCDARGRVTVNGVPLNGEPYIFPGDVPSKREFEVTVPPGRLWVMGDHRSVSADSRAHLDEPANGTIPIDKVIGRAFVVVWPPSQVKVLSPPRTFQQPALEGNGYSTRAASTASTVVRSAEPAAGVSLPLAAALGSSAIPLPGRRRRANACQAITGASTGPSTGWSTGSSRGPSTGSSTDPSTGHVAGPRPVGERGAAESRRPCPRDSTLER